MDANTDSDRPEPRKITLTLASQIPPATRCIGDHKPVTYMRHNCTRRHRTAATLAKCIWPHAVWVMGQGIYVSAAYCRATTIHLWDTEADAAEALRIIDSSGCGGLCNGYRDHRLIRLDLGHTA